MKKVLVTALTLVLALSTLAACAESFKDDHLISVVTREEGSGTRSAFVELFNVHDADKNDMITKEAITANRTDVLMTNVANDIYAIGYCSMGSLNSTVKALTIDGAAPTAANIINGSYQIQRPFYIATKGAPSGLVKDFIEFVLSQEGQEIVSQYGCIAVAQNALPYAGSKPAGSIVIGGSSSVHPLMERLIEGYALVNPNANIELQMSDSSSGMSGTINGTFDIGMASRELKDTEKGELQAVQIALDGIAVIVNVANPTNDLSKEQVQKIFMGEMINWNELQ
jgi:phosphate transport system substrate-binding protein